jgi:hypothetical protein
MAATVWARVQPLLVVQINFARTQSFRIVSPAEIAARLWAELRKHRTVNHVQVAMLVFSPTLLRRVLMASIALATLKIQDTVLQQQNQTIQFQLRTTHPEKMAVFVFQAIFARVLSMAGIPWMTAHLVSTAQTSVLPIRRASAERDTCAS